MYQDKQLIILAAGHGSRLYPLTLTMPKLLLSVNQKPAIYNMLIPMIHDGLRDITIVVNEENKNIIKAFLDKSFENLHMKIHYIIQRRFEGPGKALELTKNKIKKETILLLGDTLCDLPKDYSKSFIATCKVDKKVQSVYCMVEGNKDKEIINIYDKPKEKVNTNDAVIGLYFFKNYELLKEVLNTKIDKIYNEYQLSSYFNLYMEKEKMYVLNTPSWNDIGTLENYRKVTQNNFNSRCFNSLYLNDLSILYKTSSYEKITSEIDWYKQIVDTDFYEIVPKFYKTKFKNEYGVEFYDYLTLSEYFTFYPLMDFNKEYIFREILKRLMTIYMRNKKTSLLFNQYTEEMLVKKTRYRINKWEEKDLVNSEYIYVNNVKYHGLNYCLEHLDNKIKKICHDSVNHVSIIHGDPSFANILFSPRSMNYKLIDPRGCFIIDTIYGDYRYDLAKLRHCYHGRYDEITNNLFNVKRNNNKIKLDFMRDNDYLLMDKIMEENDINIDEIELIEGLLFISMIPLHSDYPDRQLAFFATGIRILNNQLED